MKRGEWGVLEGKEKHFKVTVKKASPANPTQPNPEKKKK
jgi:hypothetical protein